MDQQKFDILLKKYLDGQANEDETAYINSWSDKQLLDLDKNVLTPAEKSETERRIWRNLKKSLFTSNYVFLKIAASISLLLLGFYYYNNTFNNTRIVTAAGIEMKNTSDVIQKITLEDGSKIDLSPNSSLSYPHHFDKKERIVYLKGKAFFKIARNPNKPFLVHTDNLSTEVLGTSFWIDADKNKKQIEVSVLTGRVSVFEETETLANKHNGVILKPNQKIIFDKNTKSIKATIVEKPVLILPVSDPEIFNFDESKLSEVINKLQKYYGLEIILENQNMNNCIFTGNINDLPLLTQLDLICKAIGANYEQRGTGIFLKGEGCIK